MDILHITTIGEFFAAITASIVGIIMIHKFMLKPIINHFKKIHYLVNNIDKIVTDLQPNGGSSLKDQIDRIEHRLIREEMRSRALIKDYDYGVFECDTKGNNIFVNRTYCHLLGVPAVRLLEKGWVDFIHPDYKNMYDMEWHEKFENCQEVNMIVKLVTSTKQEIMVRIKAYPLKESIHGNCVGYFGCIFYDDDHVDTLGILNK